MARIRTVKPEYWSSEQVSRDVLLWIAADLAGDIRVTHRSLMDSRQEARNGYPA
ncbi:hypothetical protein [Variovorax sp.]|jgi:hypothetical protein|uniref:hypothetical protein n=1 Tax=unclassified Variovorax TaxID=663243 RepID=UPI0037DA6FAB